MAGVVSAISSLKENTALYDTVMKRKVMNEDEDAYANKDKIRMKVC